MYELCLIGYIATNRDFILSQLGEIYRNSSIGAIQKTFLACYAADFVASCLAFGYGFSALYSHKVKSYNNFNFWLLMTIFPKIVISYLNV